MKKYVTASLFIFWALVVAVLAAGFVVSNKTGTTNLTNINNENNQTAKITGVNNSVKTSTLSMVELIKHNSAQSCWLLISGKIYDVTTFLGQHPGGEQTILQTCGTDATVAYNTKDGRGRPHSASANAMLAAYYIGDLVN